MIINSTIGFNSCQLDYHNSKRPDPDGTYSYTWQDLRALELKCSREAHDVLMRGEDTAPAAWGIR